jgi:hypothetical protein
MDEKTETSPPEAAPTETEAPKAPEHKKVLPIHLLGSGALRAPSVLVPEITDDIRALAEIMVNTMFHVNGVGLAAPQGGGGSTCVSS